MKQPSTRRRPTKRAAVRKPRPAPESTRKGWALKVVEQRTIQSAASKEETALAKYLVKELSITDEGKSASLMVPPVPLPLDKYQNAPRILNGKACVALGLSFVRAFLARTGNTTGKPQSSVGTSLEFPNVITYVTNLAFRAARGELTGTLKVPKWMALFLVAIGPKSGMVFLDKKISYNFVGVPPDHTETVVIADLRNELFNASLIDGEGLPVDPLVTGGFRPLVTSPPPYNEEKAAQMFAEMNTFLSSDMVSLEKFTKFMGINPSTSGDAYALNMPATQLGDYAGLLDVQLAQYREIPKVPILAQALFVQKSMAVPDTENSRDFALMQGCGGSTASFWQAQLYSRMPTAIEVKKTRDELLRPVPILFNEILKYHVSMAAKAMQAAKVALEYVKIPNALEQAVSIYNALMGFFWNTTRPFSGTALPRAVVDVVGEHPSFLQCDASNAPSSSSRKVIMFYQLVEALRSFNVLCCDEQKTSSRTIRRVPALWQTYGFEPAAFIEKEFMKYGISLPPVPIDASSGEIWGRWFSDRNAWAGGAVETTKINLTDSPYVDSAQEKFNTFMGALKGCSEITTAFPTLHEYTNNKFVRILETDDISVVIKPAFDDTHRYADGTIFTNVGVPNITLGTSKSGPVDDDAEHLAQAIIPSMPAGVFSGTRSAQFNMILGLPEGINRENGGSKIELRVDGFTALVVGNGVIPPTYSSEISASYFFARIMHSSGGGFYKVGAKEDWSFMKDIKGEGRVFVEALKAKCIEKGVRLRVVKRLAKVCTKSKALGIIMRHQNARNTGASIERFVNKIFNLTEKVLDVIA